MGLKSTTVCLGYQQIILLSSATGLIVPQGATLALIVPETQNVRWRDDGTDPTASVGMPIFVGASLSYDGDFNRIKFIETTASAKLNVAYYA
jgi:hypothetical protein